MFLKVPSIYNYVNYSNKNIQDNAKKEIKPNSSLNNTVNVDLSPNKSSVADIKSFTSEEEVLDFDKLERIKNEIKSLEITPELLAGALIKSFKNDRG